MRAMPLLLIIASIALSACPYAQSFPVYLDLHDFGGKINTAGGLSGTDGVGPNGGVTIDGAGNRYGTAFGGGANGAGMVWEITASGKYLDLHDFGGTIINADGTNGPDGTSPDSNIAIDNEGDVFGTTEFGGPTGWSPEGGNGDGIVWEISASGTYRDLHDFGESVTNANGKSGPDGIGPWAGVTFDSAGNMYGTATYGGANDNLGMVWEITAQGKYRDLHDFGGNVTNADGTIGPDGISPYAGVTVDSAGNLYGTANAGGPNNVNEGIDVQSGGMVWRITTSGTYMDLHDFGGTVTNANGTSGPDGMQPFAGVTFDRAGNIYGTTEFGGGNQYYIGGEFGDGMVWEITTRGTYLDLHDFNRVPPLTNSGIEPGADGAVPIAGVTFDAAGNMYGTTRYGGPNGEYLDGGYGDGMVWEITASGKYLDLHDFGGAATDTGGTIGVDGNTPLGGVTFDKDGNMYGTVEIGSPNAALDNGMVWSLRAVSLNSVTVSPAWVVGGNLSTGTVSLNGPANSGGLTISLSSNNVAAKVPSTVTIPSGLSSANFAVDTVVVSKLQTVTITAKGGSVSKTVSLTVNLPVPASVTFDPSSVTGGASSVGAVTLMGPAGKDGALVKLTSKSKSATVPVSVNVKAGQTTSTFTVRTYAVPTQETATISASLNGISQDASLTIYSPALVSIKLNLSSVKGGKLSTGKVTLSGPAPERGIKVSMSSSSNLASVPATLLIPAGGTSVGFTVKTKAVSSATSVTITANLSGVTKSAILTLTK